MENEEIKQNDQTEVQTDIPQKDITENESQKIQSDPQESSVSKAIDDLGIGPETDEKKENDNETANEPDGGKPAQNQDEDEKSDEKQEKSADGDEPDKEPTDEELLVGVKTERGRERLSKLLAEGRQNTETLQAMQRTISTSGLDKESFANLMEISRLVSSKDPEDVEKGLKEFESVRTRLYQALGREAPGVDLISQYPDLAEKVQAMGMSREDALQIVQARKTQAAEKERYAAQKAHQTEMNRIQQFGQQVQQTFASRSKEADFDARIEVLKKYFSRPGAVEQFVSANPPENWSRALMWMYDNIAAPQHAPSTPSPITQNRARAAGMRVSHISGGSTDSIEARIRELGL